MDCLVTSVDRVAQFRILEHEDHKSHIIKFTVNSHSIDFAIWRINEVGDERILFVDENATSHPSYEDSITKAMPFMEGRLKWDGCVNLEHGCMLHFCGPEVEPELGFLIKAIYALGPEMSTWYY
jgi:hypothetical protein